MVELRTIDRESISGRTYSVIQRVRIDRCNHCGADVDYVRTEEQQRQPQPEATA